MVVHGLAEVSQTEAKDVFVFFVFFCFILEILKNSLQANTSSTFRLFFVVDVSEKWSSSWLWERWPCINSEVQKVWCSLVISPSVWKEPQGFFLLLRVLLFYFLWNGFETLFIVWPCRHVEAQRYLILIYWILIYYSHLKRWKSLFFIQLQNIFARW